MKQVYQYEGELVGLQEGDPASGPLTVRVRVTKIVDGLGDLNPTIGKLVRVTIEIIDTDETFEEVIGSIPPDVIADERDELES